MFSLWVLIKLFNVCFEIKGTSPDRTKVWPDLFDKYKSEINPDDYLEGVQNAATVWKGKRYGIPYDGDVLIFHSPVVLSIEPKVEAP